VELSEEELRMLEQMERALVEEDPKLASTLRGTSFQRAARRRMILGGAILLGGIGLLIVAVLLDLTAVLQTITGVLGFVVMLAGAILALTSARSPGRSTPKVRASGRTGFGVVDGGRPHRPSRQRTGSPFMERMEERWRRRRERGL
jgi:VIT1/CCC1 family predicted Fe2+/Mn2+ transporter